MSRKKQDEKVSPRPLERKVRLTLWWMAQRRVRAAQDAEYWKLVDAEQDQLVRQAQEPDEEFGSMHRGRHPSISASASASA